MLPLELLELAIVWTIILWIMIALIKTLRKVAPIPAIKQSYIITGIWKICIALGLALSGLMFVATLSSLISPRIAGIIMIVISFLVFILVHTAVHNFDKAALIIAYREKMSKYIAKKKALNPQKKKK